MPQTQLKHETSQVLPLNRYQTFAHSVMAQPAEQRAATTDRLNRIVNRSAFTKILMSTMLGLRDCAFENRVRAGSSLAIQAAAKNAIEKARAQNAGCAVNGQLLYDSTERSGIFGPLEPNGVKFFCTAEDCCQRGIVQATEMAEHTINASVAGLQAEALTRQIAL